MFQFEINRLSGILFTLAFLFVSFTSCSDSDSGNEDLLLGATLLTNDSSTENEIPENSSFENLGSGNDIPASSIGSAAGAGASSVQASISSSKLAKEIQNQIALAIEKKITAQYEEVSSDINKTLSISKSCLNAGTASGTGTVLGTYTRLDPETSDYVTLDNGLSATSTITGEITESSVTMTYTECVMEVYDFSQGVDAFPADDMDSWPKIKVLLNGEIVSTGTGTLGGSSVEYAYLDQSVQVDVNLDFKGNLTVVSDDLEVVDLSDLSDADLATVTGADYLTGSTTSFEMSLLTQEKYRFSRSAVLSSSTSASAGYIRWMAADTFAGMIGTESISWTLAASVEETDLEAVQEHWSSSSFGKSPYSLY